MTSFEPIELRGVTIDREARLSRCHYCERLIWWGRTARGKRNPFDVVDGERTTITHWSTCPKREQARAELGSDTRGLFRERHAQSVTVL